jgi:Tfp pilus assembly protein PilX/cytoskeletal protein CcmA (bactofilin family)
MLLNRMFRTARRDEGAALAAVLGLMAVGMIMTSLILTSVVSGMGFTTSTRAGVQAQAAAEAGIAAARAGLAAGTCNDVSGAPVYASATGVEPRYVATIWRPLGSGGWEAKCPVGTGTQARILSTGYAAATAVAGQSGRNTAVLEAILSSAASPTSITPSGPAVYAYSSSGFGGGGTLYSVDGSSPDVMVKTGNVVCDGGSNGISDLVVDNGTLKIEGGCGLTGNAWSSGRTTIVGGATVGGNVVAAGVTHGGTQISGNIWSSLDVTINGGGKVLGNAVGQSMSLTNGRLGGNGWIFGATTLDWGGYLDKNLTTKTVTKPSGTDYMNGYVKGIITTTSPATPGPSTFSTAPTRPVVPTWYNLTYDLTKWTGFTEIVMPTGTCSYAQLQAKVTSLGSNSGIIDARPCTNGVVIDGAFKLALGSDVAFVSNKFSLTAGGGFTSVADRRLWLITPDANAANTLPDCPSGASFKLDGDFDFSTTIATMIYTPCPVNIGSGIDTLRGQVFVGAATIDGGAHIGYEAVGLPGVDLNTGAAAPSTPTPSNRTLVSLRNVTG